MIARPEEDGRLTVLGTGQRESRGVKRGYIADMAASEFAVREAVELAERISGVTIEDVWAATARAGSSATSPASRPTSAATPSSRLTRRAAGGRQERHSPQRPGRASRPSGALHHRPRAGREAADRPPRRPPGRRHPRHCRRPVAAAQHRLRDPLGPPRRHGDRRLAHRRRPGLPQRGGARPRRGAGRAGRGRHQRLAAFRRDAGRASLAPARRARHHRRHRLRLRHPAPRRRAAQMLLRLGDDVPARQSRDDRADADRRRARAPRR